MRRNPPTGKAPSAPPAPKPGLHPRNRHRGGYDFPALVQACPELAPFVRPNPYGENSIDFADPAAVKALNRALLQAVYGVRGWDLPEGYLCPPIPGRADYLHCLADLLAQPGGPPPKGPAIRVLDIGVGASAIYPLLGTREYGWTFVGSDIDSGALENARRILRANPDLGQAIDLRLQEARNRIFQGIVRAGEAFDACLCNPPFHASAREAQEGTERKWRNLGRAPQLRRMALNFGGQGRELWCEGGEAGFLGRMIQESAGFATQVRWFTSLVSKSATLPALRAALARAGAAEIRIIPMAQGQKQSRIVAWTYLDKDQREAWRLERWA